MFMRLLPWMALGGFVCGASVAYGGAAAVDGTLPGPLPLFPATDWWNADVSRAPLEPGGAALLQTLFGSTRLRADFGSDQGSGIPYIVVPGNQPLQPVVFTLTDASDFGAVSRPLGYPIPDEAITQTGWIQGGPAGNSHDTNSDRHMLIVDADHRILFEMILADYSGGVWHAYVGVTYPLDFSTRRADGNPSATASGLALLPGLVRYDEAQSTAPLAHALAVLVSHTNGSVFPATNGLGTDVPGLPLGARLRLKAGVDLTSATAPARKILEAMKTYGLIVTDAGQDLFVEGTSDPRWGDTSALTAAFNSIHGSDLELIEYGWRPQSAVGAEWVDYP